MTAVPYPGVHARRAAVGVAALAIGTPFASVLGQQLPSDSTRIVRAEPIAVTILRDSVRLSETPRAVTILEADRTRRARPGDGLAEALRGVPGVRVEDRASEALDERIVVRGFGARAGFGVRGVRVVVDGVPATMPDGQSTLTHVDPRTVDRVEAIRGPAGAAWGNAAGGAIAIETRPPPERALARAAAVRGGFGRLRFEGSIGDGRPEGGWRVDASRVESDGHRAFDRSAITRANARWSRPGWDVVASAARWEARNPGGLSDSLRAVDPTAAFPFNVRQRTGEEGTHGQVGVTWLPSGGGDVELGAWLLGRTIDNPIPPAIVDLERTAGGGRAIVRGAPTKGVRWSLGAEVAVQRDHRRNFDNAGGVRGARTLDQIERVGDLGLWARVRLDGNPHLTASAALRYDRTGFEAEDRRTGGDGVDDSGSRTLDAWSPSVGFVLRPLSGVRAWVNLTTAFETPTTSELANRPDGTGGFDPELDPQRAWAAEIGVRVRRGRAEGEIAGFRTVVDDALVPFQVAEQPGRDFFRNAGSAIHRGIELAGAVALPRGLEVRMSYAWVHAEFDRFRTPEGVFDGHRIPGVRPHRLDAAVTWTRGAWFAELELRSTSRMAVDDANASFADGWTLVDARIGGGTWAWGDLRLDPFGGVTNLLDSAWDTAVVPNAFGERFYEPGPGRVVYVGLEARIESP